jgi:peptide/nickel transport system permease protein
MRGFFSRLLSPFVRTQGVARWMLVVGVVISALFIVLAIFAPLLAPFGFADYQDEDGRFPKLGHPNSKHWFGTTNLETDVLSRVIWGARTALEVVTLAVIASLIIGLVLGLVSGYAGGWVDRIIVLIMDSLYAFPSFLLAIVCAFLFTNIIGTDLLFLNSGVIATSLALTVIYIPQYFRVVRNTTISAKEATYVEAARALGASGGVIIRRYLFGNVIQSVPVIGTLNAADAILTLAGLGFLGIGIQPSEAAEWGYDLQRALTDSGIGVWWTALYPGLAIVTLVTGLTLVGEGLNETVNPILRRRRLLPVVIPPRPRQEVVTQTAPTLDEETTS